MRPWIAGGLAVFIVGVGVWAFFTLYERYDDQIWIGSSSEAKRNPFLAAQRYLADKGVTIVGETNELDFAKIPNDDLVFLAEVDSMLVSKSQVGAAISWIDNGGFLIVGAGQETQGYASLLRQFDIKPVALKANIEDVLLDDEDASLTPSEQMREINRRIKERQAKEEADKTEFDDPEDTEKPVKEGVSDKRSTLDVDDGDSLNEQLFDILNAESGREFYKVDLGGRIGDIHLASLDRILLKHFLVDVDEEYDDSDEDEQDYEDFGEPLAYEVLASVADERGTRLLQLSHGDGTLTVLSSSELWENDYIGLADHALFFTHFVPDHSTLHFFYNFDVPSLAELLEKYFREFIVISLVILALWLWNRGLRVQREVVVRQGERRKFSEHLQAAAKFLLLNKQYSPLLASLQEDIELQMRPFYPGFSQLNSQTQSAMLIERTELPENVVQSWLRYCQAVKNQDELLAALKVGNLIRKKL